MKYLSLFSGVGTGEKGIEQAYAQSINHQYEPSQSNSTDSASGRFGHADERGNGVLSTDHSASSSDAECIGYAEIDKYAAAIYSYHYPNHRNYGDATAIVCDDLPDFDFLIAGFPCQAFSIAGKRQGFNEARGTLFFEIARILSHKRPRHFLLENVRGLVSHEQGKTFDSILRILSDLGYFVETVVLNSKDYGVPQNRERVFFIGHLADECEREILSVGGGHKDVVEECRDIAYCLDANYYKGSNDAGRNRRTVDNGSSIVTSKMLQLEETKGNSQGGRVYHTEGIASGLKSQGGGGTAKCPMIVQGVNHPSRGYEPRQDGLASSLKAANGESGQKPLALMADRRIRRLTPIECERLQGLPDDWTKYGTIDGKTTEISDTQRYKTCGNAMTVDVIEAIITRMRGCLCTE